MSLEAIKQVTQTEEAARKSKLEASQAARKAIADADREGKAMLEAARAEAEAKVRAMMAEAEANAAVTAQNIREATGQDCQVLRSLAEARLDAAAELIVRKVVSIQ